MSQNQCYNRKYLKKKAIRLKNKQKIDVGSIITAHRDEPAYGIKKHDQFEVILWYPYYGRTKLSLSNIATGMPLAIGLDWDVFELKQ